MCGKSADVGGETRFASTEDKMIPIDDHKSDAG